MRNWNLVVIVLLIDSESWIFTYEELKLIHKIIQDLRCSGWIFTYEELKLLK